jgi:putative nucleotidyltransferase with HDIG domain
MNSKKIQQFEDEIKNLYSNSNLETHSFSESSPKVWLPLFWDYHIKYVINKSKNLAEKYQADLEAVWLGAILHDIARLYDKDPHDEKGTEIGYKMLIERDYSQDLAEKVKEIILTHSCIKYKPENLEQKIVATADAMAHFIPPFYLWLSKFGKDSFDKIIKSSSDKIERDINEKIFFEDEKMEVREEYEVLKKWFEYKT